MRILGIDPGYATTGFGILQAERASVQLINYLVDYHTESLLRVSREVLERSTYAL